MISVITFRKKQFCCPQPLRHEAGEKIGNRTKVRRISNWIIYHDKKEPLLVEIFYLILKEFRLREQIESKLRFTRGKEG